MEKIVIVGGGSLLSNIVSYILNMKNFEIIGYTDNKKNSSISYIPYLGNDSVLQELFNQGVNNACVGVGSQLNNTNVKQKIYTKLKEIGFNLPVIKGQNVIIHHGVMIGEGTIIRDAAIIQPNCKIGNLVMIGDNVVVSHDTTIGNYSQVVTGGVLGRGVEIGDNVFVGFSTVISNDLIITNDCVIGAKSLVNKSCLEKGKYFGQPSILIERF